SAVDTSVNTDSVEPPEANQFEVLSLKYKYPFLNKERPWFEMSTINTDSNVKIKTY
ncbi:unnamed protein product, partial [Didymodactylos carnosus]